MSRFPLLVQQCGLGNLLYASKRCPRHANAVWEVGCTPANVVRGMQMRSGKLAVRPGMFAVRLQTLSAACKCSLGSWLRTLGSWLYASKRCPRHANAVWEVGCAPWEVGCTPANVVRGMQMRSGKLALRPGKFSGNAGLYRETGLSKSQNALILVSFERPVSRTILHSRRYKFEFILISK